MFVVVGTVGEYSDQSTWVAAAFEGEADAKAWATAATEHLAALAHDEDFREALWECGDAELARLRKYDSTLDGQGAFYSSDGAEYHVSKVPLRLLTRREAAR